METELSWSDWLALDKEKVGNNVPAKYGAYQIRPIGATHAAYIGSATGVGGLKQRIGQRVSNPLRYLSVFEKQLMQIGLKLEFRYVVVDSLELTLETESRLINDFKAEHNDKLPPGNKQTPDK